MRLRPLLIVTLLARLGRLADAQAADTTHRVPGATVSGIVRDSIARVPLAGAVVQLVAADNPVRFGGMAVSDSLGRFTLADVPDGRYTLGFFHPMLDSLGVEAPLREVYVDGHRPVHADLGVPSPARLRVAICGPRSAPDSGALVVGIVRDARDGSPARGVTVTGEWLEVSYGPEGVVRRIPRVVATTWDNGWFAMCNVPSAGTMFLIASRGADSTDLVEVQVPAGGFLRRELYLGAARTIVTGGSTQRAEAVAPVPRRLHVGDGRLSGTVFATAGGKPLAGAQVSITAGPETRANERGEWTLVDAPVGTRMLEVRALGYYPERRRVDVVAGATPVRVALSTLKAVLDTVRVTARRLNRDPNGFERRRRSGFGRYVTAGDIARRQPIVTSDLFRNVPGLRLEYDAGGLDKRILMRGAFGLCAPAIYIDGMSMTSRTADNDAITVTADDIDTWMRPQEVTGIEIYAGDAVPPQYQQGLSGCGSILIWTK